MCSALPQGVAHVAWSGQLSLPCASPSQPLFNLSSLAGVSNHETNVLLNSYCLAIVLVASYSFSIDTSPIYFPLSSIEKTCSLTNIVGAAWLEWRFLHSSSPPCLLKPCFLSLFHMAWFSIDLWCKSSALAWPMRRQSEQWSWCASC